MPQDPNLYGQPPPKKRKGNMALSSSLDFTAQLTSLMSSSTGPSSTSSARPRKSANTTKPITPLSRKARADRDAKDTKLVLKDAPGEDEAEVLARTRRKMEAKARLYAAMKRGDYVPKENEAAPLVDFDRKWAETKDDPAAADTSSGEDDDDDDHHPASEDKPDTELIEYEDDLGRTRLVTRAERDRLERQRRRGLLGAEELERMSARPAAPSNLIYGDTIQTLAFVPEDEEKMEAIARKRDRSATPPDQKHYDADSEIRNRGTGFFKFSKDEETRLAQMTSLEEERARTEARRREQDDAKAARRKEIEDRRRDLEARRAKKMADSFLDGLAADLGTKEPPPT
ncbi:hypothetical protein B0T11DRAFT_112562 [Plectosphaerella cucumerina]|uniref:Uncharacterized protein n=1 Tax=Plectosphaerella cucumerina TaxID=40658 RepID=A0A8K0TDW6_9PEZI|nr:hypothetical protein B0T11DRAFT_112562 [Plectosphaerella cucumerina]